MKAPYWFPQSFFSRTLWLVLIVVLFSKALTLVYLMMNEDVLVDRQYSHGAALTLRAYWAASESERDDLARAAGLKRVTSDAVPPSEQHWPYSEIFERQMQTELGPETEVRLRAKSPPALWVRAPALGPDWVRIPLYPHPLRGQRIWSVLGWFLGIGLLSTAAAWIFVRQLNAPLKRLVFAARQLGQGRSVRLPVSDTPSEMTEVYRAFNQMAEDVEQAARERELMLAGVSTTCAPADAAAPVPGADEQRQRVHRGHGSRHRGHGRHPRPVPRLHPRWPRRAPGRARPGRAGARGGGPYNQHEERVRLCLEPVPPFPCGVCRSSASWPT